MLIMDIETLIEKYEDCLDCADGPLEKNLFEEFLDDLKDLRRGH